MGASSCRRFLTDCDQTIKDIFDAETAAEYGRFADECSRMDPMSLVRSLDQSYCWTCGDGTVNQEGPMPEECDDGEQNANVYGSCRSDCTLGPRCGDGLVDHMTEICDDGPANRPQGFVGMSFCSAEDMKVDWVGGFHASGHAVFDGYDVIHDGSFAASSTAAIADPLDGCMGTNVNMDGRPTEVGSADWVGSFADGSMAGKIALIQRGACFFTSKAINAQNAGAIGVIVYNDHRPGTVVMSGPDVGITIPSIFIPGVDGEALTQALLADPATEASIHCDEAAVVDFNCDHNCQPVVHHIGEVWGVGYNNVGQVRL
jgi:hypothetical protein